MSERKDRAVELFKSGYNCSQSVFAAYCDLFGVDEELGFKISSSFGGGIGRMREVCGCASGMFMIAGLATGATEGDDKEGKANNYKIVQEMAERFKEKTGGSMICKELLGLDKPEDTHVPAERTETYYKKRPCVQLVKDACDVIEETFDLESL